MTSIKKIGSYEIIREIGRGGMGVVYLAKHPTLRIDVALKAMFPDPSRSKDDPAMIEARVRFKNEAEITAKLKDPNIIKIYDFGIDEDSGILYLVMEHIDGGSLKDLIIKNKYISLEETLEIVKPIARSLDYIHSQKIIHRDLKPSNILFLRKYPILTDFGIAVNIEKTILTETGRLIGTIPYMPPEKIDDKIIDYRADIYSLGVIIYEMLAGSNPFLASDNATIIKNIATLEPPLLSNLDVSIPDEFAILVSTLMAKDPDGRPDTMSWLIQFDLSKIAIEKMKLKIEKEGKKKQEEELSKNEREIVSIEKSQKQSKDDKYLNFNSYEYDKSYKNENKIFNKADNTYRVHSRYKIRSAHADLDISDIKRFNTKINQQAILSFFYVILIFLIVIVLFYNIGVFIKDHFPTREKLPTMDNDNTSIDVKIYAIAFTPDGQHLASGGLSRTIKIWNAKTHELEKTLIASEPVLSLVYSADSEMLAAGCTNGEIMIFFAENDHPEILSGHATGVSSLSFSPECDILASGSYDETIKIWSVESKSCVRTLYGHTSNINAVAFNHDGSILASGGFDNSLKLWSAYTGSCIHTYTDEYDWITSIDFSSDGSLLVFANGDAINLIRTENGECIHIFKGHSDRVNSVAFSNDGRYFASGSQDKTIKIWSVKSKKCIQTIGRHSGPVRAVAYNPASGKIASGSEDGTVIFYR